jgi:basic membrane protein A
MSETKVTRRNWLKYAAGGVAVVAVGGAAAYYALSSAPGPTPVTTTTKKLRVAMMIDGTTKEDKGWGQAHYTGLVKIKDKYNAEIAVTDMTSAATQQRIMRDYALAGYDILLLTTYAYLEDAKKLAPEYPNTWFVDLPAFNPGDVPKNLVVVNLKEEEGVYLSGMLAALMTKTNVVGAIAGADYPSVIRTVEAYKMGARAVNPQIKILRTYLGTWGDPAKGKEAAIAQVDSGADVIYQYADLSGLGVFEACKEKRVWTIGSTVDQNNLAPDLVITSNLADYPNTNLKIADYYMEGALHSGQIDFGLADGIVDIAPFHGLVPEDIAQKIQQAKQDIIAGKIKVPMVLEKTED